MSIALVLLLVVHGLIHFMGFLKAFGLAEMPQLAGPISRPLGALWLAAGLAMLAAAGLWLAAPRTWWIAAGAAAVLSQAVILTSWGDAKYGTIANVLVLAGALLGFFSTGPTSLSADYRRETARGLEKLSAAPEPPVTEDEVARLPAPVARYLRLVGVVGQPHVRSFHAKFTGRIRAGADKPWMELTGDQHSFVDRPARLFFLRARMKGLPVSVLHKYFGEDASMEARVLGAVTMMDVRGRDLARAETVTHFNDLCLMAPGTLVDPAIRWEEIDATRARATFTAGGNTIRADLVFNAAGELVDFSSEDRGIVADDGHIEEERWSTPLGEYRPFGAHRLASFGQAIHRPPTGEFVYAEFRLTEVTYNDPTSRPMD